jgi:histidine triad (HIT) family protein
VNVFDIETDSLERLAGIAQKLSKEIVETHRATGVNLLNASGKDAQQSVFHFHLHIVPRYENDGLDLWFKNRL